MAAPGEGDAEGGEGRFRRLGQVPALDGLRAVAVLLVVFSHTPLLTGPGFTGIGPIDRLAKGGFLGVDVFFVLSGFLITALLLREQADNGRVGFWAFYQRRALRLLPALVLLLLAHAIYAEATGLSRDHELKSIGAALVYLYNWLPLVDFDAPAQGLGHLWSLAIEEQFYLLWPAVLILFLGVRRNANLVLAVIVAAIAAIGLHRIFVWESADSWIFPFVRTDTRADSLLVGALLAAMWVRYRTPNRGLAPAAWIATAVVAVSILFADPERPFVYRGGFTAVAFAVAVVVLAVVDGRWIGTRVLSFGPLRLIGRVSYGLYLWHLAVFFAVARYTPDWPTPARIVFAFGLTALFTALSWHFVEQPALRLKHRLDRRAMSDDTSVYDPTAPT
jgi:peptidoglycan/LPS O-acetylase OafA/YrhL